LGKVELRIDVVPAAAGSHAGENSGGAAAARVAVEKEFLRLSTTLFISRSDTLLSTGYESWRCEQLVFITIAIFLRRSWATS